VLTEEQESLFKKYFFTIFIQF